MNSDATRQRIASLINSDRVVLFMKGAPQSPQCGFSAALVQILNNLLPTYTTADVLEDPTLREGIKVFSSWPTVPQLYIEGEFVGGCDIVRELYASGELHKKLGLQAPERKVPSLRVSDAAAKALREIARTAEGRALHLAIDARFQNSLYLGPPQAVEVEVQANGITLWLDYVTAQRAEGLSIDVVNTPDGPGFRIENPNATAR